MRTRSRRRVAAAGVALVAAVGLSGCLQQPGGAGGAGAGLNGYVDGGSADGDKVVTILGAYG
ncbi:MAG: hypothetical protein ACXVD4_16500, partial [Nocardioides sp.]